MPELAARHASRLRFVSLVHLPLAADPSAPAAAVPGLRESEIRALAHARHVVVTGHHTLALLEGYGVPANRLTVIEPGTDRPASSAVARATSQRAEPHGAVRVLTVGTVNAIKGHDRLLRALARVDAPWHLTCAGNLDAAPDTVAGLRALALALGCEARVTFTGTLTGAALAETYAAADVFALATRLETYGMAVAEALAWHLPVVATDTGAIGDLVGGDAGMVVPADDDAALTAALSTVITDAALRARLAAGAAAAARRLPAWHDQVRAFAALLDTL
jgi:glycosyltransferase involved in cell wall biosynthesis